jgi:hypothetical protein
LLLDDRKTYNREQEGVCQVPRTPLKSTTLVEKQKEEKDERDLARDPGLPVTENSTPRNRKRKTTSPLI